MNNPDYLLALKLQEEYNKEINELDMEPNPSLHVNKFEAKKQAPKRRHSDDETDLNCTQNLVHPQWETLDPTPDVFSMFDAFDRKFFQNRLKCVTLEWSKRMYSCAGICYSRRNNMGMAITIRLSEPLLKLRPRKDLIETLLHEMIHAYCFVLGIREGNGGHGPNFKKIMYGINKVAGTNITVYHTFNDEVDLYKVHWWRCNGICTHRKPFFGYVKRTSNRAPGPNDFWWRNHSESCGGSFLKIKGPEPKVKKTKKEKNDGKDLRNYFGNNTKSDKNENTKGDNNFGSKNNSGSVNSANNFIKGPIKSNGGGTLLLNPRTQTSTKTSNDNSTKSKRNSTITSGNLTNVVSLKDLGDSPSKPKIQETKTHSFPVSGQGYSLTKPNNKFTFKSDHSNSSNEIPDQQKLRDIRTKKFSPKKDTNETDLIKKNDSADVIEIEDNSKKDDLIPRRISEDWEVLSDDIAIKTEKTEIICLSDDEYDDASANDSEIVLVKENDEPKIKLTQQERQVQIKKEIIDNSDFLEDDIELIDDDFDDDLITTVDLADTSMVDDLFGEDTLLKEFKVENSVVPCGSRHVHDPQKDIVTCPICQSKITRDCFEEHLDGCIGITIKVQPISHGGKIISGPKPSPQVKTSLNKKDKKELKKAGYSEKDITNVCSNEFDFNRPTPNRRQGLNRKTNMCPYCAQEVDVMDTDYHLTICSRNAPSKSRNKKNNSPGLEDMQSCPVCNKKIKTNQMNDHLDECLAEFD